MKCYINDIRRFLYEAGKEMIVIYGAGAEGERCLEFLQSKDIHVSFFVDSNPVLNYSSRRGRLILGPQVLEEMPVEKTFIFVAVNESSHFKEISELLDEKGYSSQDYFYINQKIIRKLNSFNISKKRTLKYASQYKMNEMPLFRRIEIETMNRCNGKCEFCPVNAKSDTRPYAKMTDELFYSIIGQLKELDYSGHIQLFSNNEPLLDDRILHFSHYARNELPKAYFTMHTNGRLLSLEKFRELIDSLDFMIINNYGTDYEFLPGVKQVYEYCLENTDRAKKVRICKRLENQVLSTRSGASPNAEAVEVFGNVCPHPFSQMVIRPDGKCSLCCNDALGQMTLGDVNTQSILEIWNGAEYTKLRNSLINKGSESVPLCHACDNPAQLIEAPDPDNRYINKKALLIVGPNYAVSDKYSAF